MPLMVEVVSIMRTWTVVVDEGAVKEGGCAILEFELIFTIEDRKMAMRKKPEFYNLVCIKHRNCQVPK
jgi:hypothetical protein